jgi:hypothetical protein
MTQIEMKFKALLKAKIVEIPVTFTDRLRDNQNEHRNHSEAVTGILA